jgi:hypothetical protein
MKARRRVALNSRTTLSVAALLAFAIGVAAMAAPGAKGRDAKKIEFNRDVRPIIFKCYACHGPDAGARMMDLRLDQRSGAIGKLADGKFAIVPGHPEQSELIKRVFAKDPGELMPPPSSNKFVSDEEKQTLLEWIKEGAEYKEHWAFVPPVRSPLPKVEDASWAKTPIDTFIEAKLEENHLKHSPEADRRTLIRRVYLDLIGLPPTPDEVDAFVMDRSPNAYEKVVDHLLASPRYGERMAMDWMDYSRYADSNGFQSDWERFQWRWRDWVINAFNNNMPYNEFALQQIAGDLIPHATEDERLATGFNRNHRINTEGGVIAEEWRIENVIDRVATTSETFLGLTAGCARCHDHKYDPITQKDFYSLCAYFNNVSETGSGVEMPVNHPPTMEAPLPDQERQLLTIRDQLSTLKSDTGDMLALQGDPPADWKPAGQVEMGSLGEGLVASYKLGNDSTVEGGDAPKPKATGNLHGAIGRDTGSVTVGNDSFLDLGDIGDFEKTDSFSYGAWIYPTSGNGSLISRMDEGSDFRGWDIMFDSGRPLVHLIHHWSDDAVKVLSTETVPTNQWSHVFVTYDGSSKSTGIKIYINGKLTEHTVEVDALKGSIRNKVSAKLGRRTNGTILEGQIDNARLYHRALTADEVAHLADVSPAIPILAKPAASRTLEERNELRRIYARETNAKFKTLDDERTAKQAEYDKLEAAIPTVMIMDDAQPRKAHVLVRGLYDHLGDEVQPAIPAALGKLPEGAPNNRLGFAEWMVSEKNPLFARVTVNRMWARLFGTGICATVDDFGTRAEFPSHPELLDWLATEFIRLKYDQKAMWKELVTSAVYRQSSEVTPAMLKVDPGNRLLEHGPRFRLPGEVIRDQALQFGGLLKEKIGGPSVYPYQPAGIWDETNNYGNMRNYKHAKDSGLYRRSLYTIWKRTAAPPNMTLFDVPSREVCVIVRARTDTPMQALTLENDVTYVEAARALAIKMLEEGGPTPDQKLRMGFYTVLDRLPTPDELAILRNGLMKRFELYRENPHMAKSLISQGDLKNDPKLPPADVAAYTIAASTMLNLDETVTKE